MKHSSLIACLDSTHAGQATQLVDLDQPGKKEVPQGCRERPGSQCDGRSPRSTSQVRARTRYDPAQPCSRARGAEQFHVGATQAAVVDTAPSRLRSRIAVSARPAT